jgi:hypothetical protein
LDVWLQRRRWTSSNHTMTKQHKPKSNIEEVIP